MLAEIRDADKRRTIADKIDSLGESPRQMGKPLKDNLKGYRSIRAAGRYRVIYAVSKAGRNVDGDPAGEIEGTVTVVGVGIRKAGSRKDVYAILGRLLDDRL